MNKTFTLACLALLSSLYTTVTAQQKPQSGSATTQSYDVISEARKNTAGVRAPESKSYPRGFESGAEFGKLYEPGGAYDYINRDAEILDKRDESTKHFLNNNGTITAVTTAGPTHYKKNGLWNTILNDVYPSNKFAGFGYANIYNRFQTYYGNNLQGGIKIVTEDNRQIDMMQNAGIVYLDNNMQQVGAETLLSGNVGNVKNETVTYTNLLSGIDASIEQNSAGYELNYTINNLSGIQIPQGAAYVSFREGIKCPAGSTVQSEQNDEIIKVVDAAGKVLLKYKAPVHYEKNALTDGDSRIRSKYYTEQKNGIIYIHVLVPVNWLTAQGRNFPLVIDPVVTVTPNVAQFWTFTVDNDSGCDYSTDNDSDDNMRVGFDDGNFDNDDYQCYAEYNISSIPTDACIQHANVRWYQYNFNNASNSDNNLHFYFQAYDPITTDPVGVPTCDQIYNEINSTGTWYRYYDVWSSSGATMYNNYSSGAWEDFYNQEVGPRVKQARNLNLNYVAFSLDNAPEGVHSDPTGPNNDEWIDYRGYSSGNRPQLVINYETPFVAATSITASPGTTICPGTPVTLTRFDGTTGSVGSWGWYTGSTLIQYSNGSIVVNPASTTTYCVRGENICGNTTCTPITITVQSNSTAATGISGTTSICPAGSTTLSVVGGSLGTGAQWFWYSGSCGGTFVGNGASIVVSPASTTTYYVRAQGTCNTTSCVQVTVTVNTNSSAPGSINPTLSTICNGQSTTLTVNGGSLGTGAVWRWYAGGCGSGASIGTGSSITVSPATTTTYYVRAEGTCGNTTCASTTITVNQLSVAATSISGTSTICNGQSTTLSVIGGSLGTGATWQWYTTGCGGASAGSGTSITVSPTSTTTYYVRAEGTCNTTICASLTVTVNQLSTDPTGVSGTTTICEGTSTTLSVVGGSLGTGATWNWFSGSCGGTAIGSGSSITVTPTATTSYYVRASGSCNTTNCAFTTVTVNDTSVPASSINGSAVCIGSSTSLSAVGGHLGVGASWNWYVGSCGGTLVATGSPITVSPAVNTTYYLRAEGLCNTTVCIPYTVVVNPLPNGSINGSATICNGVDTTITFNFAVGTGPFDIIYTDGTNVFALNGVNDGDVASVTPGTTTTYSYVQITDQNSCVRTTGFLGGATITVAPLPVISNVTISDVLCNGDTTGSIAVNASSGTPAYQYSNDNGANYQSSSVFTGLAAGTYNLYVKDALNCTSGNPFIATVNEPTVLDHSTVVQSASCANVFDGSITVNATGGVPAYAYSLNGGPTQPGNVFTGLQAGTYIVGVFDANGCSDTSQVAIPNSYAVTASLVNQTNVSCFGGVDGSLTVQLTGGIPPYSYSINGVTFQSSPTFTGLAAGNYVVTLRDSKGCTDFVTTTITQPNLLAAIVDSVSNILCNGGSTGAIYITVNGGTPNYSFTWTNGATTEDITGLTAGTYNVAIVDANGCTTSAGATISQPLPLFLNVASFSNLQCFNDSTGYVDVTVSGGVPPYTFNWSNGATTEDISSLDAGTYDVTVTDANGCQKNISQTLTEPAQLTSTISGTDVSCNGAFDGTVDVTVSGGTAPYFYSWNNGATSQDLANVAGGTYTVAIADAHGCTATNTITIAEPTAIAVSANVTNVLCNGATTGAIDLTVSGGTPSYTYAWSNGATSEDLSALAAGAYTVTVTDNNGCTVTATYTITQPTALSAVISSYQDVSCSGGTNGAINIAVNGGVTPYAYLWSNGTTTEDVNNLAAGTYTVTITDFNGCTATLTQTIVEPTVLTASISAGTILCNGGSTDIDLTVSGGTTPYNYFWNVGATSEDLTGVGAGSYSVVVSDAHSCTATASVSISQPAAIAVVVSVTDIACNGAATGAIDITVSGGTAAYTFAWSNGATTEDLTGVSAGTYVVTVTDANGCSVTASGTITEPAALTVVLAGHADVSCNGGNNGSIDINVFGGTPLYTYLWSNSATSEDLNGLSIGTYSVVVTDANACTASFSTTITEPTAITTSITKTDVTCPGASNGAADLTVNGGVTPYTYLWSNGATTQDLSGVTGGTYTVIVTDANSCTSANSVTINEGLPIVVTGTVTNVLCNGGNTGVIDITVSGGNGTYTYNWSNGATTEDLTAIAAGNYSVTVSDANSCSATASFAVTQPAAMVMNASVINVSCAGGNNGSIDITVNGGVFPYTFVWTTTSTNEDVYGLSGGTYSVTVTDANSCTLTQSFTLTEPTPIVTSITGTNVSCNGASDGAADLTVSGGVAPYSFLWSNFNGTEDVTGLSGGLFFVIVTDANGCDHKDSVLISEPAPLALTTSITNISCYNANDGAIDLTVTGGTPAYTYNWSNGATTEDLSNLQNGVYAVTVTDANLCTATTSVVINNPSVITANFVVHNPLCAGSNDGSIDLIPSGGTPSYTFSWNNGFTTEDISGLDSGTYIVTITDTKGCSRVDSAVVTEPQPLVTSGFIRDVSCHGAADGFIDITAYGGTLPYFFEWSTAQSTEDIGSLPGSNYFVTVTDANGCQVASLYIVNEPAQLTVDVVGSNVSCFNGVDGHVAAVPAGGVTPYHYLWTTFDIDSAVYGLGAGKYTVQLTDSNGCFTYDSLTLTQPTEIAISGVGTDAICFGASTAAIDITVSGGTPTYTYVWSNGPVTEDNQNIPADTYTVTVSDANSCQKTASFTVGEGVEILAEIGTFNPICNGGNTGSATALVSGGDGPYTYAWNTNPPQTTVSINGLGANVYVLTVTDSKNCSVTATATLTEPAPITITTNATGSNCFNTSTGQVTLSTSGGTAPYNYTLNGIVKSDTVFTGLAPGTYGVLVTDVNGCQGSAQFTVASPSQLSVDLTAPEQTILTGMQTQLNTVVTSSSAVVNYIWTPSAAIVYDNCPDTANCPNPLAAPKTTTNIMVTVVNADGCSASDTLTIYVLNQPSAFIPTAFTPNGDGLNDRFEFDILGAEKLEVNVFNRWGEKVYFNANQPNGITGANGWDGTKDGKDAPNDTYVYQLVVTYFDGVTKDISGTVSIMR